MSPLNTKFTETKSRTFLEGVETSFASSNKSMEEVLSKCIPASVGHKGEVLRHRKREVELE